MNRKVKRLIWAVVILFLLNAATLGTILYHSYSERRSVDDSGTTSSFTGNAVNGRFFRQMLGFTNEQMDVFRKANQEFRPQTSAITTSIDSLKAVMFKEMKKPQPDTLQLNMLSKKIGDLHSELKHQTYQFYLKIRAVCSEQQQSQLEKMFEPLFINENLPVPPRGFQRGWNKANN